MTPGPEIAPEDVALLDRLAARIGELRLETPALLALETARPLSLVDGQAMVFLEPIVQSLFRLPDYRRFAALVERRECLGVLVDRIEARAAERGARPAPPAPTGRTPGAGRPARSDRSSRPTADPRRRRRSSSSARPTATG